MVNMITIIMISIMTTIMMTMIIVNMITITMIIMMTTIMMTMMHRKTEKVESKKEGVEDDGGLGSMAAAVGHHHHSIS